MLLMKIVYGLLIIIMGFQLIFMSYFERGILFIVMGFIVFISGVSKIPQYDCLDGELYKLENRNYLKQNQKQLEGWIYLVSKEKDFKMFD